MKKDTRLYNVIFPIWLLWVLPPLWLIVLPANFAIDLLVIVLALKVLKAENIRAAAKAAILKTWIAGFLADFIGTLLMAIPMLIPSGIETPVVLWIQENLNLAVTYNPFETLPAFLYVTLCTAAAGFFIYLFNFRWCLKKALPDAVLRRKTALALAVFTAPYLFYLPTNWFY